MFWEPQSVIGQLGELARKLDDAKLSLEEIDQSTLLEEIVTWVDQYSKLDPRFYPDAPQFRAAAGPIRAAARQLEMGNRSRAKRYVLSALSVLDLKD